ncbi:MAG: PEGA domain-containing protein [Kofleriaceae bacterium]|nr:PEGA domain-containing protein [Kofleriaceae bacterium]
MRTPLVVVLLAACSDKTPPKVDVPPPATTPDDAGVKTIVVSGVDPSGMHLDDDSPRVVQQQQQPNRPGRPIDVTLRSTPPGAQVAVDGVVIGNTPAYWSGMADGREHQFLFTLRGHGIARYRFVPVSSGVIHARLEPIVEQPDAGVPPPEVVPQPPANIAPPPTVVKPVEQPPAPLLTPDAGVTPAPPPGSIGPQP